MELSQKSSGGCGSMVFAIVWTAFSSIFFFFGIYMSYTSLVRSSWPEVSCTITSFEIAADKKRDPPFQPAASYEYQWEEQNFTGTKVWVDKKGEDDYEDLGELEQRFRDGELTTCFVNPANPNEAALITGLGDIFGALMFVVMGGGFVAIGIAMFFFARKEKKSRNSALSSKDSDSDAPNAILIPFFSVFALAGLGVFFFAVIPQWIKYLDAKGWQETPAEVIWSRVESYSDDDGNTYSADIFYRYEFGGESYRSNTSDLFSASSSGRQSKQEKVDNHPPGTEIICYVNPDRPWQALLERHLGWRALFALFPLPFIAVGVGGLWWMLKSRAKAKAAGADKSSRKEVDPFRHSPTETDTFHQSAEKRFAPGKSRILWFFGSIAIALFWNGITSVFVWQVIESFRRDNPEWFLTIFITPFVLIGIGLIVFVLYRFLALFAPSPKLKIAPGEIRLGESAELGWQISGNAHRINHFAIYIVGNEEAQYQRGTDSITVTEIFCEKAVFDSRDPRQSASGFCSVELPRQTMPSWNGDHNSIKWTLEVRGKISMWPDVSDSYELTVLPPDLSPHS